MIIFSSGTSHAATINVKPGTNAIGNALNNAKSGDTLNLSAGTYHEHSLVVNKNIIITGPTVSSNSSPTAIIDAQKKDRIFYINSDVTVTLKNLYLKNGVATSGGGVYNHGNLIVQNSYINTNTVTDYGGAIYNSYDGTVSISGSHINGNSGAEFGGGIYNIGSLTITNSTINSNSADFGAGIENEGILNVNTSTINGNQAINSGDGGAIYNFNAGTVTLKYSIISNNSADYGGAISNHNTLTVIGCDFKSNKATGKGNALYNYEGTQSTRILHFNRFYDTAAGYEIYSASGSMDAKYNWWLSNSNPTSKVYGTVKVNPYLILKITASPKQIKNGGTSQITATLLYDSNGTYHDPTKGHILNGLSMTITTTKGTLTNIKSTINGAATAILKGGSNSGTATVSAKLNNQTVNTSVTIDNTSPEFKSSNPTNAATGIARNKTITVTFNENIQSGTNSTITLKSSNGTTITISKSISGKVLTITHSALLAANTKYTLTIYSGSLTDLAGNPIAKKTISFTTGSS
ncbi:MAG TPA: Ig-like domain-containing protein [Methanobacterium sp.]|nr:Ig-like domain-containing protein [Methanobacterium sp.]